MLLLWLDTSYLLGMAAWILFLFAILVWLLRCRRGARKKTGAPKSSLRSRIQGLGFGLWFLCASLTIAELIFALFIDHSEAFNASMIAKRWFQVHFDSQRNDDGFRERRLLARPLPEGMKRVLFLGDSFTAGHGVNNIDDRFTERLEVLLNAGQTPEYQVYNMGEPGFEISMIRAMESAVLEKEYPVETLIYCYMMNDIEGYDPKTTAAIDEISKRRETGSWLVSHSYFINWMYHRWVQYSAGSSVDYFPHLVESYNGPPWSAVAHELDDMVALSKEKGVEFRLVIFPFMHNLGSDYPFRDAHEKLVAWAKSKNVPVLDMMPVFALHSAEKLTVNAFDNHPNERAHQIIADEIFKWLQEKRPVEK